jgi:hypothetical protein
MAKGARGEKVEGLQQALKRHGFQPGAADGIFGPKTERALKAFQQAAGLPPTGVADAQTMARLQQAPAPQKPRTGTDSLQAKAPAAADAPAVSIDDIDLLVPLVPPRAGRQAPAADSLDDLIVPLVPTKPADDLSDLLVPLVPQPPADALDDLIVPLVPDRARRRSPAAESLDDLIVPLVPPRAQGHDDDLIVPLTP